jgi:hypothetical protein
MATRYWVGGAGTWDSSSTTNWSATSGGSSGASAPTFADDAIFNSLGGTGTVTIASGATCRILTWTSTTLTMGGSADFTIFRTFGIETGVTITYSGTMTVSYGFGTSFYAGTTLPFNVTFVNTGTASWSVTLYDFVCTGTLTLTSGDLEFSSGLMTVARFSSNNTNTRSLTFGGSNLTITGSGSTAFDVGTATGFTTDLTGTIKMSSSSAKTFAGGGASYPTLSQTGTGALTISGSNTFVSISNTVQPTTITFTSGTTQTFTSGFALSGTSGNLVTIGATTTSAATLSKSSGTISVSHCSISYSTATGGASWKSLLANGNVNGGNNSGWMFTVGAGKFFQLF